MIPLPNTGAVCDGCNADSCQCPKCPCFDTSQCSAVRSCEARVATRGHDGPPAFPPPETGLVTRLCLRCRALRKQRQALSGAKRTMQRQGLRAAGIMLYVDGMSAKQHEVREKQYEHH